MQTHREPRAELEGLKDLQLGARDQAHMLLVDG